MNGDRGLIFPRFNCQHSNFFFGDFLLDQGEPERARSYLQKVLEAPDRAGRDVADAGRREEARNRLGSL